MLGQPAQPKYFSARGGNVLAKANKLAIEVPEEEEDSNTMLEFVKYGKNSPANERNTMKFPQNVQTTKATSTQSHQAFSLTPTNRSVSRENPQPSPDQPYVFEVQQNNILHKGKSLTPSNKQGRTKKQIVQKYSQRRPSVNKDQCMTPRQILHKEQRLDQFVTRVQRRARKILTPRQAKVKGEVLYKDHLFQTFQALKFVRNLPAPDLDQIRAKRVYFPRRQGFESKKTLVVDLDETLVHCCEDFETNPPDVVLPLAFPTGETGRAGINIRPYAIEFLEAANEDYEVIVFTASHQCYADVVLNHLDPTGKLIHHRLYRDSCILIDGVYVKDLRVLIGRRLKDIVIVDNAAYSFGYQLDNGVPIISWHDNYYDIELYNLIDYIKGLSYVYDIRDINRETFRLRTYYEDYIEEYLRLEFEKRTKQQFVIQNGSGRGCKQLFI